MTTLHSFCHYIAAATASMLLFQAQAQTTTVTLHEGDNRLPQYAAVDATFTPQENCKVLIEAEDQYLVRYDGQTYSFQYIPTSMPSNQCEIDNVAAGTTITLHSDFVMSNLVRITTFAQGVVIPLEVTNVSPATGSSDFWNNNGLLNVTFNKQVRLSGAKLSIGDVQANLEIVHVSSAISINVGTTLNQLLSEGTLHPGDRFQVTLNGLYDANDPTNLYNGTGTLNLRFTSPQPQYKLLSTSVNGELLSTQGLNPYTFLSYYAPDSEDGLFVLEFEAPVQRVEGASLHMGNRDLDAQGKYYEGPVPVSIDENKVIVDARGVLRTLNILFPAVVEEEPEPGETVNAGLGAYDTEHITLRVSSVVDINGNYFTAQQVGNVGSYSFYMNYRELMENISLDGDNKMAGDEVVAGETIRLWVNKKDLYFEGIHVAYITEVEEGILEPASALQPIYETEDDPYEGIVISFVMPDMPHVAVGQTVRVSLHNAASADGMPHDLSIEFKAGDPSLGIQQLPVSQGEQGLIRDLSGRRIGRESMVKGSPYIINHRINIYQ